MVYSKILADSALVKRELNSKILDLYAEGYYAASIDSLIYVQKQANAYLSRGVLYRWGKLTVSDDYSEELVNAGFRPGLFTNKPLKYRSLAKMQSRILNFYENNGFPFAMLQVVDISINRDTFSGRFIIDKGPLVKIDSINLTGNAKISATYLGHYLNLKKGAVYKESIISDIDNKINKSAFLKSNSPVIVSFRDKYADVKLNIDNKKANQFNGIIGFVPNDKTSGKLLITGELTVLLLNSFRQGEKINFEWRKTGTASQEVKSKGEYRYIAGLPLGVEEDFRLYKKDSTYLTFNNKAGLQLLMNYSNYVKIFYENDNSNLIQKNTSSTMADYKTRLGGAGIYIETFDNIQNPRKGYQLNFAFASGKKTVSGDTVKSFSKSKIELDFQIYQKITTNTVIKFRTQSAYMVNLLHGKTTYDFYENELFRIGGLNSLRGFDQESVYASAYSIATLEYRLLFETNSALFAFVDGAYYEKHVLNDFISDYPVGFGVGIDFETRAGIFTLSYALGKQFDNPIEIRSAKVHFGFVNRF